MRMLLLSLSAVAVALPAAAQTGAFATETGTIQVSGPRPPAGGDDFLNIEGAANGVAFRSYGVVRWTLADLHAALDTRHGAGNWTIERIELRMTQSNAAFSTEGDLRLYFTPDDATDIKTAGSPLAYPFDDPNAPGNPDLPVVLADPLLEYTFTPLATGTVETHELFSAGQGGQRGALAADVAGDDAVTIVFEDATAAVAATYRGQNGAAGVNPPELVVIGRNIAGNTPPIADAGPDQTVTDSDLGGNEIVALDGSGSFDVDGTITSYVWTEGATTVGLGPMPNASLAVGVHTITLTVTDNDGGTDTDEVTITVLAGNIPPVADAGANFDVTDTDNNGSESVLLDGSGSSDPDSPIATYTWRELATVLATGPSPTANVNLPVGTHTIRLTVTDTTSLSDFDFVTVVVRPGNIIAGHDFDTLFDFIDFTQQPPAGTFTSPGDGFQIFQRGVSASIPFTLLDDTNIDFPNDAIGIVDSKKLDAWFGANDLTNTDNPTGVVTATWQFDVAGATAITVRIDMAAMGDFEGSGAADSYRWTTQLDGGAETDVFVSSVDDDGTLDYEMESGRIVTLPDPMSMNGVVLTNVFQTFAGGVSGTGNVLTLRLHGQQDSDEAFAFDNIFVTDGEVLGCPGGDQCDDGDVDGDCDVDLPDLAVLLSNFGRSPATREQGDLSGDGNVNLTDLAMLLSVFGSNCQ